MPVKPKAGETKNQFISRCVGIEINNGYEKEQAVAMCYSMWEEKLDDNVLRTYQKIYKKIEKDGKK